MRAIVLHFPADGEGCCPDLLHSLFPHLASVQVETAIQDQNSLLLRARTGNAEAACRSCGTPSRRVHSRYHRLLRDMSYGQVPVTISLEVRRFFCVDPSCPVRTFAEQVPELAAPYARRTTALRRVLEHIALALAGRAGARLAASLGITVSRQLLIRLIRALPDPPPGQVRVLGVDEFAKRKGRSYATVLINLDTHEPIDVLEERTAEAFADWLRAHPGVQVICRDRAGGYAEGARDGAPGAIQVADRWHLWKNLCDAVTDIVRKHRADLRQPDPEPVEEVEQQPVELPQTRTAERTRERHAIVHALLAEGKTHTEIVRMLGLSDKTVRRFRQAATADELISGPRHCRGEIDQYAHYLQQRWDQGIHDAARLHAEIAARGYRGSKRSVRRFVQPLRAGLSLITSPEPPPKIREVTRWITSHPDHLDETDTLKLKSITTRSPQLASLAEHVTAFAKLLTSRAGAPALEAWIASVEAADTLPHLQSFASGLRRDYDAVVNAVTLPYSSGAVEGNICRVKALKRQMYGRANLDLLRKRILLA